MPTCRDSDTAIANKDAIDTGTDNYEQEKLSTVLPVMRFRIMHSKISEVHLGQLGASIYYMAYMGIGAAVCHLSSAVYATH